MKVIDKYSSPQVIESHRMNSESGVKTPIPYSDRELSDSTKKYSKSPARWNKEGVRQLLRKRFKNFYESSYTPNLREEKSKSMIPERINAVTEYKVKTEKPKERSISTISVTSSRCSGYSVSSKSNMEYTCLNCINKELINDKQARLSKEMEVQHEEDAAQLQRLEELRQKCQLELRELKGLRNKEMQEGMKQIEEQRIKRKLIEYLYIEISSTTPRSTTLLNDSFGIDHAKLRAEEKQRTLEQINRRTAAKLLEDKVIENAKTNFTYLHI